MTLSARHVKAISQAVYRKFPEVAGKRPTVKAQTLPDASPAGRAGGQRYLLIFKGTAVGPGGKTLHRLVRVVADESGEVIKISTSR